jgi:transposase-like protein
VVPVSDRRRVRRSAAQWRTLVAAFEQSGVSRRAFCARHGVSVSTFDWWRKRLGTEPRCLPVARADGNALFVELSAPLVAGASDATRAAPAWDLELELGAGMVLRLRRGVAC